MTDFLISIELYPIWILFFVTTVGMRSHVWGKLSLIMFLVTGFNLLNLYFNLIGWSAEIKYLAPFAIFLSGISGIVVSWAAPLPEGISRENKKSILLAAIFIAILYVVEILMNISSHIVFIYIFNSIPHPNHWYWYSTLHDIVMISATVMQALILRKGGIDGFSRIITDIKEYSSRYNNIARHAQKNKIVSNRKKEI